MRIDLNRFIDHVYLVFILAGVILLVLAAFGSIPIPNSVKLLPTLEPNWRYILLAIAILFIVIGSLIVLLDQKNIAEKNKSEEILSESTEAKSKVSTSYEVKDNTDTFNVQIQPCRLFVNTDDPDFIKCFEMLADKAKRIILIGIGITYLHDEYRLKIINRTTKTGINKCELEIYMANPFSPEVETRLIEEESKETSRVSKDGLIQSLRAILYDQSRSTNSFRFKVFSHYPTLALIVLDDEYFFYPYGYALLGTRSPVSLYSKSNPYHHDMISFFEKHYERVKKSAVDTQLILDIHDKRLLKPDVLDKLIPFAVYIVPEATSSIYEFGSTILGYDLRTSSNKPLSPFADYVGSARDFGFHLTVADALYFTNEDQIEILSKEIEYLLKGFLSFQLDFKMQSYFPDKYSISLVCNDVSGKLQVLHNELVIRCYRKAVASNFSPIFDKSKRAMANRTAYENIEPKITPSWIEFMAQRYHAPYILQQFKPHFSLLTAVVPEKMEEVFHKLNEYYENNVAQKTVKINSLVLMSRPDNKNPWLIKTEIPF